jgi:NAD-dependent DNA ligase
MSKPIYYTNKNMLVPYYLMYSYLYYKKDISMITDEEYDRICKELYKEWKNIEHFHKPLINKEALLSGTGYTLKYPDRVKYAAEALVNLKEK